MQSVLVGTANADGQKNREKQKGRGEGTSNSPLFRVAGMFAIGEPGWADKKE